MRHLFPTKKMYWILILCAVLIFAASVETMMRVKDSGLFDVWRSTLQGNDHLELAQNELFSVYVSIHLSLYLMKIIVPLALGVYTYFAYVKLGINKLFVFVWTVLVLGSAALTAVEVNLGSFFYYFNLIAYAILALTLLSLLEATD
jgi:hypothetical protein